MDFVYSWSPLFGALGAVALAILLVVGQPNPRRAARSLAIGAVAFCVVDLIAVAVLSLQLGPLRLLGPVSGIEPLYNEPLYLVAVATHGIAYPIVDVLAIAAWALLLYAAAQSGRRVRLVAFTLVLMIALALQISLTDSQVALLAWLWDWARQSPLWLTEVVFVAIKHLTAVAALVCAVLLPVAPATSGAESPASPS